MYDKFSQEDTEDKTINILIIDDNKTFLQLISTFLRRQGFNVETATEGMSGVKKYKDKQHELNVILLDVKMPHMNGFEVARFIRSEEPKDSRRIPIIAISGEMIQHTNKDIDWFVQKPIQFNDLLFTILQYV